jgi:hypothetical protein
LSRTRIFPLLVSISTCVSGVALADIELPPVPRGAFRTEVALRSAPEVDAKVRALQQSLFKRPEPAIPAPAALLQPAPAPTVPASRPVATVIPPPAQPIAPAPVIPPPKLVSPPRATPPTATATPSAPSSSANLPGSLRELSVQPAVYTPYDRYLGSVHNVIDGLSPRGGSSMMLACSLLKEAHAFRYLATEPYRAALPSTTEAKHAGDCKAKALWLYDRLGDGAALYVIGKLVADAKNSHAWVYWRNDGQWWILDPTNRAEPIAANSVANNRYVPYYSFGKAGAFRHKATRLYMPGESPAVTVVASRDLKSQR